MGRFSNQFLDIDEKSCKCAVISPPYPEAFYRHHTICVRCTAIRASKAHEISQHCLTGCAIMGITCRFSSFSFAHRRSLLHVLKLKTCPDFSGRTDRYKRLQHGACHLMSEWEKRDHAGRFLKEVQSNLGKHDIRQDILFLAEILP